MITQLEVAVLTYVLENKGQRCEEIATALEQPASVVSAVLRGLRDKGQVKSKGKTRGTCWRAA